MINMMQHLILVYRSLLFSPTGAVTGFILAACFIYMLRDEGEQ